MTVGHQFRIYKINKSPLVNPFILLIDKNHNAAFTFRRWAHTNILTLFLADESVAVAFAAAVPEPHAASVRHIVEPVHREVAARPFVLRQSTSRWNKPTKLVKCESGSRTEGTVLSKPILNSRY